MNRIACLTCLLLLFASCQAVPRETGSLAFRAYQTTLRTRIYPVWERLAAQRSNQLTAGTVKLRFEITPDGRIEKLSIASNTGNRALADVAIQAVQSTLLAPLPPALLQELSRPRLAADLDFTAYPSR